MYEFTKKTVEEDVNAVILFAKENSQNGCTNYGICGETNSVCNLK